MAKLVVLSAGMAGRSHELKVDKTTVGRVEDNTFQIAEASVSSHHCEVLLRGSDVVIKDLNSTNGTFINGERITESVLKPGQILRLGQVELRLEDGQTPASAPAAPTESAPAPAVSPLKKPLDQTMVLPRGVSLNELEQGARPPGFETSKVFSKKNNKTNKWFLIIGIIVFVIIITVVCVLIWIVKR
jgi:pSer/pThr/pTyr-binding forkhead associated (FHA) protein